MGYMMQVPPGDLRIAIAVGDHLALFRDLDRAMQRSRWLAEDTLVGGATTAPNAAAAPMKQFQGDAMLLTHV